MKIIEINWTGPFSIEQIKEFGTETDYGVYQIYGIHSIMGINSLLYIGKAVDRTFAHRIPEHNYIHYDFHDFAIYIGRIGSDTICNKIEWDKIINDSERILIDFSQPPFNSQINDLIKDISDDIVLLNQNKRYKLPFTISTAWKSSTLTKGTWKAYSNKMY